MADERGESELENSFFYLFICKVICLLFRLRYANTQRLGALGSLIMSRRDISPTVSYKEIGCTEGINHLLGMGMSLLPGRSWDASRRGENCGAGLIL